MNASRRNLRAAPPVNANEASDTAAAIVQRPDGFYYWIAEAGRGEVGPFATYELAEADRDSAGEDAPEPGESVEEAEDEVGINAWLDSDTGAPVEGHSPPHLAEE